MSKFAGDPNAYSYDIDNLDESFWTEKDEVIVDYDAVSFIHSI